MQIGAFPFKNPVVAAPMAGVTDRPFRRLCRRLGAAMAVAEMVSADPSLRLSRKSRLRQVHTQEDQPRVVQIVGSSPALLAEAARYNADLGAQIIDINLGCPAKKVCGVAAGSALLGDESKVAKIFTAVVAAVDVPVTVKIRTGPTPQQRNAVRIAKLAEQSGLAAITVHGRTRACAFRGHSEIDSVTAVKAAVRIGVIVNGDVATPEQAAYVLRHSAADAVMIGRAAQGNPWIFGQIATYLNTGLTPAKPSLGVLQQTLLEHLDGLYEHYGYEQGVRVARKHIAWYCKAHPGSEAFWRSVNQIDCAHKQRQLTERYFENLKARSESLMESPA